MTSTFLTALATYEQTNRDALVDYALEQRDNTLLARLAQTTECGSSEDRKLSRVTAAEVRVAWIGNPNRTAQEVLSVLNKEKRGTVVAAAIEAGAVSDETLVSLAATSAHRIVHRTILEKTSSKSGLFDGVLAALASNPHCAYNILARYLDRIINQQTETSVVNLRAADLPIAAIARLTKPESVRAVAVAQVLTVTELNYASDALVTALANHPSADPELIDDMTRHIESLPEKKDNYRHSHRARVLAALETAAKTYNFQHAASAAIAKAASPGELMALIDGNLERYPTLVAKITSSAHCDDDVLLKLCASNYQVREALSTRTDLSARVAEYLACNMYVSLSRFEGHPHFEHLFDAVVAKGRFSIITERHLTTERLMRQTPSAAASLLGLYDSTGLHRNAINAILATMTGKEQLATFATLEQDFNGSLAELVEVSVALGS